MASENETRKWRLLAAMCGLLTFVFVGLFVMIGGAISKKTDGASWGIYLGSIIAPFVLIIVLVSSGNDSETGASAGSIGSSTRTPTAAPLGATRDNPIPFGDQIITDDGFSLWIEEVVKDATQIVLDENQFNSPPPDGHQYLLMQIKAKNNNLEPKDFDASFRLRAVGDSNVEYTQFDTSCGVIPNKFESSRDLFQSGELTGNICFSVKSSDVDSLVMYDDPWLFTDNWLFIALP